MSGVTVSLEGRRALVTGSANGLGAAIIAQLNAAGASGAGVDLSVSGTAPEGWHEIAADVRSEQAVRVACAQAAERLGGRLDIVVAAAGIVPPWRGVAELDLDEWDNVFAVNVRGVAATLKHAAPYMRDGGAVVAVASLNSWRGDGNLTSYTASKHAVLGIVRSAAIDLGPRGIRVNAVAPGPVATDALKDRMKRRAEAGGPDLEWALAGAAKLTSLGRIATAADIAGTVLFLSSDLSAAVTGQLIPIDGGLP
jgi:NAD(P)-dependent dehydrogenase (short-subunit alcohol dehydrogenase family)